MGLVYLDAKAPNLLVAYTLLTVATLPLDAVTLCMLGHPASFLQWARSTAYFFILIFKCASLVLMGMLHTKARPTRPIAHTTANSDSHAACTLNVTHTAARACAALPQLPPARRTRATQRGTCPPACGRHTAPRAVWCRSSLRSGYDRSRKRSSSETPTSPRQEASTVRDRWVLRSYLQTAGELQWPSRCSALTDTLFSAAFIYRGDTHGVERI